MTDEAPATKKPRRYRRPLVGRLAEWLILLALTAAAGLALTAKTGVTVGGDALRELDLFYRLPLLGQLQGRVLPVGCLLSTVAVILLVQAALGRLRPEVRGITAAYGFVLLLAPVLNYDAQVEVLTWHPDDLAILSEELSPEERAAVDGERFHPRLPVTPPLVIVVLGLLLWAATTPTREWPEPAKAAALVTLLLVGGGAALLRWLILARGNALSLDYTLWPPLIASLWRIGQLGVAATGAAVVCREARLSRVMAVVTAALLGVTAVLAGGWS